MTPKEKIEALYKGIGFFYPALVYGPEAQVNNWDKIEYEGKILSKKDFLNIVFDFTKTNDINLALKKLLELKENIDETKPEDQPDRTTPENLEELVEEREKQKEKSDLEKEKTEASRRKRRWQLSQQKRDEEKQETPPIDFYPAKIRVIPAEQIPTLTLNKEEKEKIYKLGVAARIDPGTTQRAFEATIKKSVEQSPEKIKQNVSPQTITKAAVDLVNRVQVFGDFEKASEIPDKVLSINPVSPLVALTNPDNPKVKSVIADSAQSVALALETERAVNLALVKTIFPEQKNVLDVLYGPDRIVKFEIADNQQTEDGIEIDINNIIDQGEYIKDIWQKLASKTLASEEISVITSRFVSVYTPSVSLSAGARAVSLLAEALPTIGATAGGIYGIKQSTLISQWAFSNTRLLSSVFAFKQLAANVPVSLWSAAAPAASRAVGFISKSGGTWFFMGRGTVNGVKVFAAAAKFGEKAGIGIIASKAGVQVAAAGSLAKIGAALGAWAGPIGIAITTALGFLFGKLLGSLIKWIKKNPDVATGIGAVFLVGGLLLQSPVLIIGGAAAIAAGGLAAGSLTAGAIAGGILLFGSRLGKSLAITIGLPIIVMIAVTPIIVYFILFIINSGAYVVPPTPSQQPGQVVSPYIGVDKTPGPPGPFGNSKLPLDVEYTIAITAKKGALTNININYECNVTKKTSPPSCPGVDPAIPVPPSTISPGTPFVFSYKQSYAAPDFEDTLVVDTVTVTADAPEQAGAVAASSAVIKIGKPPEDCPGGWPVSGDYGISQTPHGSCTHTSSEAVDIMTPMGVNVKTTHSGVATVVRTDGAYRPAYVDIQSTCGGTPFVSRYAHLSAASVITGQHVTAGESLGTSGSDGTGPHLHYEFRGITMITPYVPKSFTPCCGSCGSIP
ncbi:MAG: peptidoglycan DD-metalloendopeptidase family protein [bacterium]|nr:peptidoglycan DD-metalloendopeptidase family protein [bacterium]